MDDQTAESRDRHRITPTQTEPRRSGRRRLLVIVGLVVLIAIIALALLRPHAKTGAGHGRQAAANAAEPVAVTSVSTGSMPIELTELGTVVPITNVTMQAKVTGYLMQVLYQEGQHVKKGDLLEVIDPRPYQAIVDQYEGLLAHDKAVLEEARVDNARYQRLIAQNSVAAQTARDQEFVVQQDEGQVKNDEGNLAAAKLNVFYCYITAPVDGRVGIRGVDMGNYVTAGSTTLTTLTQMQPISVIFTLPQDQLAQVTDRLRAVGDLPVSAWDSANLKKIADGTVRALDSQIDTSTGTVRLRAIFTNEDEHLFPNQFVNAHLLVDTLHDVMLLPTNALQTGPNGQFVYVVQPDSTVKVQYVKVGVSDNDHAVITSGVKIGDRVVTDGTNHLRPGAKVSIQADHPAAAAQSDTTSQTNSGSKHHKADGEQGETQQAPSTGQTPPANTGNNATQSGTNP